MTTRFTPSVKSPALANPTEAYTPALFRRVFNAMRLYFNEIDNAFSTLFGTRGGRFLNSPYGAYESRTTQTVSVIDTPTLLTLDTTHIENGMYRVLGDGIHVEQDGVYNVQYSLQVTNADTQIHDMALWLRINGVDHPYSSSVTSVSGTHGGQPGYAVLAANFFIEMNALDYVEFWWATNSLQVTITNLPPITSPFVNPGSPAAIMTLSFVSALQ